MSSGRLGKLWGLVMNCTQEGGELPSGEAPPGELPPGGGLYNCGDNRTGNIGEWLWEPYAYRIMVRLVDENGNGETVTFEIVGNPPDVSLSTTASVTYTHPTFGIDGLANTALKSNISIPMKLMVLVLRSLEMGLIISISIKTSKRQKTSWRRLV